MPYANGQYKAPLWFSHFLDTNGNQTGTIDAIGDYSITPEIFYIQPPVTEVYIMNRLIISIHDTGNFTASIYGAGAILPNGVDIQIKRNGTSLVNLTNGHPVKENGGWGDFCYDVDVSDYTGNDNYTHVRWTFEKAGAPLLLNGAQNDTFEINLSDDFTFLTEHTFVVQGYS